MSNSPLTDDCYRYILNSLFDALYLVDRDRKIVFWNKAAEELSGYQSDEVIGFSCRDNILRHVSMEGEPMCDFGCPLHDTLQDGGKRETFAFLHHKEGHRVPVHVRVTPLLNRETGEVEGAIEVFNKNPVQPELQETVLELNEKVRREPLTGLFQREYSLGQLSLMLSRGDSVGVIFIDIDDFKEINDRFGHFAGDQALKMVARTLTNAVREQDILCRWGGEEFAVIIPHLSPMALNRLSQRIRMLIASSWLDHESGEKIQLTASIGLATSKEGESPQQLIARADKQMYRSKEGGKNRVSSESDQYS